MPSASRLSSLFVLVIGVLAVSIAGCGGGTKNMSQNPQPTVLAITAVSPNSVEAGSGAFSLHVTGEGFVSGSVVTLNGSKLSTTYVSSTQLDAAVAASLIVAGGNLAVGVVTPSGQSTTGAGGSSTQLAVDNGVPTITELTPNTVNAGTATATVQIAGTNFVKASVASFGGAARKTTYQSATQLTMQLTAADLATVGKVNVTVTNPSPGGGVSNASAFSIVAGDAPPVLTSLSPSSVIVGSPATPLTIFGTGFTPNSKVSIGSYPTPATVVSPTKITTTVPQWQLGAVDPQPLSIAVQTQYGQSNQLMFDVLNPVPAISSISPAIVTAGAPDFTLFITASGLIQHSEVLVNGSPRQSSSTLDGRVTVRIQASDVAAAGTLDISIVNPAPGGGSSATFKLKVIAGDNRLRSVNLPANSLVWDSKAQHIYAAIPGSASSDANSVVAIDPATGAIVASQTMPSEPDLLAITDNQQYLYVSLPAIGSVARLKLPSLAPDIQFDTGASTAPAGQSSITGIEVAPGFPHTVAVAKYTSAGKVLAIYDDAVQRPNVASTPVGNTQTIDTFQWGADDTVIYGTPTAVSGGAEFHISVLSNGAALTDTKGGVLCGFSSGIVYDRATEHLYDPCGNVIDPSTGKLTGYYAVINGPSTTGFAVDSSLQRVYFINDSAYPEYPDNSSGTQIQVFDQTSHTYIGAIYLTSTPGAGKDLIRWGKAGLAFVSGNAIYLLDGPFVAPGAVASSDTGDYAIPAPSLTSLNPESVPAGSPDTTVTISGSGFTPSSFVTWNGNVLESTVVSTTEMQATIPAAALAAPAAGPVIAVNDPNTALSNPLGFTVTPNLGTGMQFTALNLAGSDLVWDPKTALLYESVTNQDLVHGNAIASIDPAAGALKSIQSAPEGPYVLALSSNDEYLYVGFSGQASVERYDLPAMNPDLEIPLGVGEGNGYARGASDSCDFAVSVRGAPGEPQTIAVAQGNATLGFGGCGAVAIFDGATPRKETLAPVGSYYSNLAWGATPTSLYAQSNYTFSPQFFSTLSVSANGVSLKQTFGSNIYLGFRPHFDSSTGYVYSDGGAVTDPTNGAQVGNFNASGLMVPDSTLGRAFFLGQTPDQVGSGQKSHPYTLQIFDLKTFKLLESIVIPNVIGHPFQMVRWGTDGIAFTTGNGDFQNGNAPGMTYILSGPMIAGGVNPSARSSAHVGLTWNPGRPARSGIDSSVR